MSEATTDETRALVMERAAALFGSPDELLGRFDRNGDGVLDPDEWSAARAVLEREVLAALPREELLDGRYALIAPLGRGGQAQTWLADDRERREFVALKELDFAKATHWEAIEQFTREAQVLAQLDHPSIPTFFGTFAVEVDGISRNFIAQEFVDGRTLEGELRSGGLFTESRVRHIAAQVLDVFVYLHALEPPVLHRDVKPANLIIRADATVVLVDFGAVASEFSSAVVGTTGYMPPEQLMGHAVPASDLYALGTTLLHLLTRKHPGSLVNADLSFDWSAVKVGSDFGEWLQDLLEPMPEDRFVSAVAARSALEALDPPPKIADAIVPRNEFATSELELVSQGPRALPFEIYRGPGELEMFMGEPNISPLLRGVLVIGASIGLSALVVIGAVLKGAPTWAVAFLGLLMLSGGLAQLFQVRIVDIKGDIHGMHIDVARGFRRQIHHIPQHQISRAKVVRAKNICTMRIETDVDDFALYHGTDEDCGWLKEQVNAWIAEAGGEK